MYESQKPACVWLVLVQLCDDETLLFCSDDKFVVWDDIIGYLWDVA
jgi:hypothetical protein